MRKALEAAVVGAGVGTGTTVSAFLGTMLLHGTRLEAAGALGILIPATLPGFIYLLAGMLIADKLLKRAEEGRSRGSVLALGTVLGLGTGLAMGVLAWVFLGTPVPGRASDALLMAAFPAGGAGMGLSCAWLVTHASGEAP